MEREPDLPITKRGACKKKGVKIAVNSASSGPSVQLLPLSTMSDGSELHAWKMPLLGCCSEPAIWYVAKPPPACLLDD